MFNRACFVFFVALLSSVLCCSPAYGQKSDVDTPENLQMIVDNAKRWYSENFDEKIPSTVCSHGVPTSLLGKVDTPKLVFKCEKLMATYMEEADNARRRGVAQRFNQATEDQEDARKRTAAKYAADVANNAAAIRGRTKEPAGCNEQILLDDSRNKPLPVITRVSLASPAGLGRFIGKVEQIDGEQILANEILDRSSHFIIKISSRTKVFDAPGITTGSSISGYGTQTGTRKLSLVSGVQVILAVIDALCVE